MLCSSRDFVCMVIEPSFLRGSLAHALGVGVVGIILATRGGASKNLLGRLGLSWWRGWASAKQSFVRSPGLKFGY